MGRFHAGRGGGRGFGRGRGGRGRGGGGGGPGRKGASRYFDQQNQQDSDVNGEPGGRLGMLPEETMSYYRNVLQTLQSGFGEDTAEFDPQSKEEFLNNVFSAFKEEAVQVSQNQTVSWILELLFAKASPRHLRCVVAPLFKELTLVMFDRFASHVTQALVEYLPAMYDDVSLETGTEEVQEFKSSIEKLCKFVESHMRDVMTHTYGSHVLRSLLEALGGVKVTEQVVRQKQGKGSMSKKEKALSPLIDYGKYSSFSRDYKHWFETLKGKIIRLCNFSDHLNDQSYSPVLQTVLLILNKSSLEEYEEISNTIIEKTCLIHDEDSASTDPAERLPGIVQSDVGSYLIELMLTLASKDQLRNMYDGIFKERIIYFCVHPRANYVLQSLLAAAKDENLVSEILETMSGYFEDILAVNHVGIIIKLAGACQRTHVGEEKFLQLLMSAFHCQEPASRQLKVVPLIASFRTYEVFYKEEETGDAANEAESSTHHLTEISLHGALLLQQLLQFDKPDVVVNSLLGLSSTELALLGCDSCGSHIIDTLFKSPAVKQKSKDNFLKQIVGMYTKMATSRNGSRCLENIWKECSVQQRILIAEDLCKSLDRLESDFSGKFVCHNFGLLKFTHRRKEWLQMQGADTKKQRVLKEVLKGTLKKKKDRWTSDGNRVPDEIEEDGCEEPKNRKRKKEENNEDDVEDEAAQDVTAKKKRKKDKKKQKGTVVDEKALVDSSYKAEQTKSKKVKDSESVIENEDSLHDNDSSVKSKKQRRKKVKKRLIRNQGLDEEADIKKVKKKNKKKVNLDSCDIVQEESSSSPKRKKKKGKKKGSDKTSHAGDNQLENETPNLPKKLNQGEKVKGLKESGTISGEEHDFLQKKKKRKAVA